MNWVDIRLPTWPSLPPLPNIPVPAWTTPVNMYWDGLVSSNIGLCLVASPDGTITPGDLVEILPDSGFLADEPESRWFCKVLIDGRPMWIHMANVGLCHRLVQF